MKDINSVKNQILELAEEYFKLKNLDNNENEPKKYVPASGKKLGVEELKNMLEASLDMFLTSGHFNDEFERKLANRVGVKFALTTNSGSSANLLALTALTSYKLKDRRLKPGDEVISVAAGFPTTINPIIQNKLIPVFIDIELNSYNIDTNLIEQAITNKTKAIFLAHTLGNMYDIEKIMEIANKYKLWVIEDTCDALGAKWNGKTAGTFGHIATCSFYPAHHITMGEGGAVLTSDPNLWRIIMSYRDWGRDCWCKPGCDNTCTRRFCQKLGKLPAGYDHKYTYSHIGYNLKITDWQASIGLAQLNKLDEFLAIRKRNANHLLESLQDLKDYFILPNVNSKCESAWFGFLLTVKKDAPFTRNQIQTYLENNGIGTRLLFAGNVLRQPFFTENEILCKIGKSEILKTNNLSDEQICQLTNTEYVMNNTFWVGVAQNLTIADINKTSQVIHDFIKTLDK